MGLWRCRGTIGRDVWKPIIEKENPISALINNRRPDRNSPQFRIRKGHASEFSRIFGAFKCLPGEKGSPNMPSIKVHCKTYLFPIAQYCGPEKSIKINGNCEFFFFTSSPSESMCAWSVRKWGADSTVHPLTQSPFMNFLICFVHFRTMDPTFGK